MKQLKNNFWKIKVLNTTIYNANQSSKNLCINLMKDVEEPTETIIKTNEDFILKKVINIPCGCLERVYIVKIASHKIKSRFNEISVNI